MFERDISLIFGFILGLGLNSEAWLGSLFPVRALGQAGVCLYANASTGNLYLWKARNVDGLITGLILRLVLSTTARRRVTLGVYRKVVNLGRCTVLSTQREPPSLL